MKEQSNYSPASHAEKTYDKLNQEGRDVLSKTAMGLFLRVSVEIPASITAQGALIAKYCKESELQDPLLLSECLLHDNAKLARITEIAAKMHEHAGINLRPGLITHAHVNGIVRADFAHADAFMNFDAGELDFITQNLYEEVKKLDSGEGEYFARALEVKYGKETQTPKEGIKERASRWWFRKRRYDNSSQ